MVREAGGTISGIEGSDDPLKTGHVICGNELVHGELLAERRAPCSATSAYCIQTAVHSSTVTLSSLQWPQGGGPYP